MIKYRRTKLTPDEVNEELTTQIANLKKLCDSQRILIANLEEAVALQEQLITEALSPSSSYDMYN